jgi:hypothetical protein
LFFSSDIRAETVLIARPPADFRWKQSLFIAEMQYSALPCDGATCWYRTGYPTTEHMEITERKQTQIMQFAAIFLLGTCVTEFLAYTEWQ